MFSSSSTTTLEPRVTYLIDEFDEPLSHFAPKVSCNSDPGWGMYEGPNV